MPYLKGKKISRLPSWLTGLAQTSHPSSFTQTRMGSLLLLPVLHLFKTLHKILHTRPATSPRSGYHHLGRRWKLNSVELNESLRLFWPRDHGRFRGWGGMKLNKLLGMWDFGKRRSFGGFDRSTGFVQNLGRGDRKPSLSFDWLGSWRGSGFG